MVNVTLKGITLASSTKTESVEGNHYFPRGDLVESNFKPSSAGTTTMCGWKGLASYLDVSLPDGTVVKDAAWYYPQAKSGAKNIEGYVAFYKNKVQIA